MLITANLAPPMAFMFLLHRTIAVDRYVIDEWSQDPANFRRICWSDVCLYMVSTPSPYTKEAVNVRVLQCIKKL